MTQEETNRLMWESKKQKAIKRLQDLTFPEHFVLIQTGRDEDGVDDHDYKYLIANGCNDWMLGASGVIVQVVLNNIDDTKKQDN